MSTNQKAKVLVLFYSTYGHVFQLANAAAEGAQSAGVDVTIKRVQETLPLDVLEKMKALESQQLWAHIPLADREEMEHYDGFLVGSPTRFGNMAAQMKSFVDSLGFLWVKNSFVGKPVSLFTSTSSQHGGIESTILTSMVPWLNLGCVITGLPYSYKGLTTYDEVIGSSPYGAGCIANMNNPKHVSKFDLEAAKFQGKHLAEIAKKLKVKE